MLLPGRASLVTWFDGRPGPPPPDPASKEQWSIGRKGGRRPLRVGEQVSILKINCLQTPIQVTGFGPDLRQDLLIIQLWDMIGQ